MRGRPWLWLWLLIAWLVPQQAAADDGYETFVDQSYLYNVFVSGTNTVTITVRRDGKDVKLKVTLDDSEGSSSKNASSSSGSEAAVSSESKTL